MKPAPYTLPAYGPPQCAFKEQARLSEAAYKRGDKQAALTHLLAAHALSPSIMEFPATIAVLYHDMNQFEEARRWHEITLKHKITKPEVYYNYGSTLLALNDFSNALRYTLLSCRKKPTAEAFNNLGNIWLALGDFEKANHAFNKSLLLNPTSHISRFNLGNLQLLTGDFREGWENYDYRILADALNKADTNPWPWWTGEPLHACKIYVECEQGTGDTFQFCRYLHILHARYPSCKITLHVAPQLDSFMCRNFGTFCNVVSGERQFLSTEFDYKIKLLSLARPFWPDVYEEKYLTAPCDYEPKNGAFHIGLCWAGNPDHKNDRNRSMKLDDIFPVVWEQYGKNVDVVFWSLQKDYEFKDDFKDWIGIPSMETWEHTCNLIASLDLIITVDTSIAHLAGAMGKPVWLMLPKSPDWRWLYEGDTTHWYPSMKIYRQALRNDWRSVIENVTADLQALLFRGRV